jgi:hypothetical protein
MCSGVIWVALVRFGTPTDRCSIQWMIANQQKGKNELPENPALVGFCVAPNSRPLRLKKNANKQLSKVFMLWERILMSVGRRLGRGSCLYPFVLVGVFGKNCVSCVCHSCKGFIVPRRS